MPYLPEWQSEADLQHYETLIAIEKQLREAIEMAPGPRHHYGRFETIRRDLADAAQAFLTQRAYNYDTGLPDMGDEAE